MPTNRDRRNRQLIRHVDAHIRRGKPDRRALLDGRLVTLSSEQATIRIARVGATCGALYVDVDVYATFDVVAIDNYGTTLGRSIEPVRARCIVGHDIECGRHLKRWSEHATDIAVELVIAEPARQPWWRPWRRSAPPFVHSVHFEDADDNVFDRVITYENSGHDDTRRA